jgi:hypothetical protein
MVNAVKIVGVIATMEQEWFSVFFGGVRERGTTPKLSLTSHLSLFTKTLKCHSFAVQQLWEWVIVVLAK